MRESSFSTEDKIKSELARGIISCSSRIAMGKCAWVTWMSDTPCYDPACPCTLRFYRALLVIPKCGWYSPPGATWQCRGAFLPHRTAVGVVVLATAGRDQGCCWTSYNAQDSSHNPERFSQKCYWCQPWDTGAVSTTRVFLPVATFYPLLWNEIHLEASPADCSVIWAHSHHHCLLSPTPGSKSSSKFKGYFTEKETR